MHNKNHFFFIFTMPGTALSALLGSQAAAHCLIKNLTTAKKDSCLISGYQIFLEKTWATALIIGKTVLWLAGLYFETGL